MSTLEVIDLHAGIEGKKILKGVSLTVKPKEIHALMGPNGSGKSTLSNVIMGHPSYTIEKGDILLDGKSILELSPDERAKLGLFLAFQYPVTVPGVTLSNFLRAAVSSVRYAGQQKPAMMPLMEFRKLLDEKMGMLGFNPELAGRHLNDGFSGGEKKRAEMIQMAVLDPKIAVLDETDSGLDIDAVRIVANGVKKVIESNKTTGALIITHYNRILKYITPHHVHIMMNGKIIKSGGKELAHELEEKGYDWLKPKAAGLSVMN